MNTLFRNAQIILPDSKVIEGTLGVKDHKILFVGDMPLGFKADRIIDCKRNILMPGLVNTHTHLPMTLFRSAADDMPLQSWLEDRIYPLEDKLTAEMVYWGCLLACAEMIQGGVTACNDMYFFSDEIARAVAKSGMRGLIAPAIVDPFDEEKKKDRVRFYNQWHASHNDRIRFAIAPHAEYTCNESTLLECARLSKELGVPIHIHVSETFNEHEECKERHNGKTPIQYLDSLGLLDNALLAHCVHVELDDIARIAAKNAVVLHNPQSNLKLASGIAPVPAMLAHSCHIALGTDGAASNNNLDMLEELRLAALIHKGITNNAKCVNATQALNMATRIGARALGWNAGVLEVEALADIVMIDSDALCMMPGNNVVSDIVYSADKSTVLMTMVDGEILYEQGEHLTLSIDEIRLHIMAIREQLIH